MNLAVAVPVLLGAVVVVQATLNSAIAARWSLAGAAVVNMSGALVLAVVLFGATAARNSGSPLGEGLGHASWWWLLPGMFGFLLVVGLPWSLSRVGALSAFVALVGSQVVCSVLWDRFVDGTPLGWTRIVGAVLAVLSVALVNWK